MDHELYQAKVGSNQLKLKQDLEIFLSVESAFNTDLWDHFEHVVHIFMT